MRRRLLLLVLLVPMAAGVPACGQDRTDRYCMGGQEQAVITVDIARDPTLLPELPAGVLPRAFAEAVAEPLRRAGPGAPAETLPVFDLVCRMPPGPPEDAFWTGSDTALAAGWLE